MFLKQALAFLQVLLLPVWQGVELNSTHLKKRLRKKIAREQLLDEKLCFKFNLLMNCRFV